MSYLVLCTFDLKNASSDDYKTAYSELRAIGLNKVVVGGDRSNYVIPTTTTAGEFNGANSEKIRDDIRQKVKAAFTKHSLRSEIFIVVGDSWAWGSGTT